MWISDDNNPWLRAHDRDTKQRVESEDILLYKDGHGFMALGIWSDGTTMWVAAPNGKIQAYDLDTGARRSNFDIATTRSGNGLPLDPGGLWSDGEYMFYGEQTGDDIHIYRLTS